jgi:hypothetical protein
MNTRVLFTQEQRERLESEKGISITSDGYGYDYDNQSWILNGRYKRCGHSTPCNCFGTLHNGEPITL